MKNRVLPNMAAIALTAVTLGPGNTVAQTQPSSSEASLAALFQSSMLDMELARLASLRAASPKLKQFADQVIDDQKSVNVQLSFLADSNHVQLSCGLNDWGREIVTKLSKKTGSEFDRLYTKEALASETKTTELMKQVQNEQSPEIRSFALRFLPMSSDHADKIRSLSNEVAGG